MAFEATEATNLDGCRTFSEVAALSLPTMQVSVLQGLFFYKREALEFML
jgi:hypothetical protein